MKIVGFEAEGRPRLGVVEGDNVVDLQAVDGMLPADLVIVNPPRAGIDAKVARALVDRPPARLIYISCDPATLARDLGRLSPKLEPRSIRCFDLFPQTAHVETIAELTCATT